MTNPEAASPAPECDVCRNPACPTPNKTHLDHFAARLAGLGVDHGMGARIVSLADEAFYRIKCAAEQAAREPMERAIAEADSALASDEQTVWVREARESLRAASPQKRPNTTKGLADGGTQDG